MWYFSWILGVGFAAAFSILNALWFEIHETGAVALPKDDAAAR